jgi:glutaredoxin
MPRNSQVFGFQTSRAGSDCGTLFAQQNTGGGDNACLNSPDGQGQFSGGSWAQGGRRKRGVAAEAECVGSVMADALVLEDGVKFDLTDMEDAMVTDLIDMIQNGTESEGVPESFKAFVVLE